MQNIKSIDKTEALSKHFLFRQLLPVEIERIISLIVEKRFDNGQIIFMAGDDGSSMMIVLEGKVQISAISEDGKEITLNYIEAGGLLGEIALLDGKKRSANATAAGNCRLACIQRAEFIPYLRANSDVAIQLLMVLCEKLRNTSYMLENLGLLPVPARLAKLILKLADINPDNIHSGYVITLSLSQQKIANLIGTTRESVNRTLRQWQVEGLIKQQQQQMTLLNPKQLISLSESVF